MRLRCPSERRLDSRLVPELIDADHDVIGTCHSPAKLSRNLDKTLAKTNELRTMGTDALLAAAREAGVRRFVAQTGAAYGRYSRQG